MTDATTTLTPTAGHMGNTFGGNTFGLGRVVDRFESTSFVVEKTQVVVSYNCAFVRIDS